MPRHTRDPIVRLLRVLALLPEPPRKIAARRIYATLREEGHEVTVRTIERDLHRLRAALPITVDDDHRPFGWSWNRRSAVDRLDSD